MFANCKYEELSHPKTQKMYHPILLTLLKMRPHDSQSSREIATPSSGTSPVASYKEVPPPPGILLLGTKIELSRVGELSLAEHYKAARVTQVPGLP